MLKAHDYARQRKGPAFVHAHVIRPYSHSLSDDEVHYRPTSERDADAARDPLTTYPGTPARLRRNSPPKRIKLAQIATQVDEEIEAATGTALSSLRRNRTADTIYNLRSTRPTSDPTAQRSSTPRTIRSSVASRSTMVDLINSRLRDEMVRDPRSLLVFGEDVADVSRDASLGDVKGKGGVPFKVTWGLQSSLGGVRVYNSPSRAEAKYRGARAIGLATRGMKPVVEIQFFDYIWPAYMQLRDELALLRWRSNNANRQPVVVRVNSYGGYPQGWRGVSLADGCGDLHRRAGVAGDLFVNSILDANGLLRIGDPLRGSGALP